jgi:hypothetical protein
MKKKIEETLQVLIGLPFWNAGRSATVEWFDFGWKRFNLPSRIGGTALVGEYVLDTESAWHPAGPNMIIVGSQDRAYPAGSDPYKGLVEFDWDQRGANRCDERMRMFLEQSAASPPVVRSVEADSRGGLKIRLSGRKILQIFPHSSLDCEYWRFFEPKNSEKHFVVTAHGIE